MISFVIYASKHRLDNLLQTIRFLNKRERKIDKEIIVVYQDDGPQIDGVTKYDMDLDTYRKPLMCNFGVKKCSGELVALLDSDRILPENYFYNASKLMKRRYMITTNCILNLDKFYSDVDINKRRYKGKKEYRSSENILRRKNLFSGNTLFFKSDYEFVGGMDERYVGYGYTDNDITRSAKLKGIKDVYLNFEELHLYHPRTIIYGGEIFSDFQIISAINSIKYSIKWRMCDNIVLEICSEVVSKMDVYPSYLKKDFLILYKLYKRLFTV